MEVAMIRYTCLAAIAAILVGVVPLQSADAAGCPSDMAREEQLVLSNAEYDRLCNSGRGGNAIHSSSVASGPVRVNMTLNVPSGDPRVSQRWYGLGQRTEDMRFRHGMTVRTQGHREDMDGDRSAQRWTRIDHRHRMDVRRMDEREVQATHSRGIALRRQALRERSAAVRNLNTLLRGGTRAAKDILSLLDR